MLSKKTLFVLIFSFSLFFTLFVRHAEARTLKTDTLSSQGKIAWMGIQHPRMLADVNGDGLDDIIGFGEHKVWVSLSQGSGYATPQIWLGTGMFTPQTGWQGEQHPRVAADVNGDGMADIVGFGANKVFVALSQGNGFQTPEVWLGTGMFTPQTGWQGEQHPRVVADVNGDGMADIVGFGANKVFVALSQGNGFQTPEVWLSTGMFTPQTGWQGEQHPRVVADVNGDGMADIVGFDANKVFVALSQGNGFQTPEVGLGNGDFTRQTGWNGKRHPRIVADVNGDGAGDIVGFGEGAVLVSLYNYGYGPARNFFEGLFTPQTGWQGEQHPRVVADVNGDGMADIVGFSANKVFVALSQGNGFQTPEAWLGTTNFTRQEISCNFPTFSQRDSAFSGTLHTAQCTSCSNPITMKRCGCTITSLAMIFAYYGASTNPRLLDKTLGTQRCPLSRYWAVLPSDVGLDDVSLVAKDMVNWLEVERYILQDHPVMLYLYLKGRIPHYVVVVQGFGEDYRNYIVVDPMVPPSDPSYQRRALRDLVDNPNSIKGVILTSGTPYCSP